MIERHNRDCVCLSLDAKALRKALALALGAEHQHLFSAHPVFVSAAHRARMAEVVQAVGTVVRLPSYREDVLSRLPEALRCAPASLQAPRGVFLGYDFHLAGDTLGLIEINTNAGGAMLNAVLARAQRACCADMEALVPTLEQVNAFEDAMVAMFQREWALARHGRQAQPQRPLRHIAIVDDTPQDQYLYPEFLLFQQLFERHGLRAVIADPAELRWQGGRLWYDIHHKPTPIDLVYNRLTDFPLSEPAHAALREAWLSETVVLSPNPIHHALYADKRNLTRLSNPHCLDMLGVDERTRAVLLQGIPTTTFVTPGNSAELWQQRRQLFFKPAHGFGSRAAYRGDKLTRRVWDQIQASGDYVAQALVTPGERIVPTAEEATRPLKFDLRNYVYDDHVQWLTARLYQGQTTNFRTPGGGFAPVYSPGI
ncbi:MAG: hypothetical protein AB3X38_11425 [Leptothrix ochracea]|uniref:hypothetical protein n=2 Tax=Leptothrix ochracea TaxID=735331 RepID=UPI0034E27F9B